MLINACLDFPFVLTFRSSCRLSFLRVATRCWHPPYIVPSRGSEAAPLPLNGADLAGHTQYLIAAFGGVTERMYPYYSYNIRICISIPISHVNYGSIPCLFGSPTPFAAAAPHMPCPSRSLPKEARQLLSQVCKESNYVLQG